MTPTPYDVTGQTTITSATYNLNKASAGVAEGVAHAGRTFDAAEHETETKEMEENR